MPPGISTVKGVEFDLQANLKPLSSKFLRGFVIGANLTLARSETFYPLFEVNTEFIPEPPFFITTVVDTVRSGQMVGQADVIANAMLGYEIGGFSARASLNYQSDALSPGDPGIGRSNSGVGRLPDQDFFDASSLRVDFALRQRLDKKGQWTLLFNLNNLTNQPERAFLGIADRLKEEEFFGPDCRDRIAVQAQEVNQYRNDFHAITLIKKRIMKQLITLISFCMLTLCSDRPIRNDHRARPGRKRSTMSLKEIPCQMVAEMIPTGSMYFAEQYPTF